jgi:creatinine amidohydrolase
MSEPVLYTHLSPVEFQQRISQAPIAYLPLGTLEWHGEHLPLGADGLQAQGFFIELATLVGGIVLPPLFLGPDIYEVQQGKAYYGMDIAGFPPGEPCQLEGSAYWIPETLFDQLLDAILSQLARVGFKIVVAHGHGPSTKYFRDRFFPLEQKYGLRLFHCWREEGNDGLGVQVYTGSVQDIPLDIPEEDKDDFGIQTDHAAANETSLMMALHPALVHLEVLSTDPNIWPRAIIGKDPRRFASAEKGRQAIRLQTIRMADLLRAELEKLDPADDDERMARK